MMRNNKEVNYGVVKGLKGLMNMMWGEFMLIQALFVFETSSSLNLN